MGRFLIAVISFLSLGMAAQAANIPPCGAGAAAENILPVSNGITTYCVSDFGWSDSWFIGREGVSVLVEG